MLKYTVSVYQCTETVNNQVHRRIKQLLLPSSPDDDDNDHDDDDGDCDDDNEP